ncbi:MAG: enoyl-CoA hydratase/isomerase family protein [Yoonia sp.]|nr:enoyl-CoA hydratase/isomerase family protein [Yoonia sp.]
MTDIIIRTDDYAGHITLNRPHALNALTWDMCLAIEDAIDGWRNDDTVKLIIIDGAGDRAFCSGGDIADMYASGQNGDLDYGRKFWRDEYRLNSKLAHYPKPIVTFLHGFTMGGGVGVGCHASHRIVCENSQVAMPECTIGLVPDVGGTYLLARAPGFVGTYLGITGARMSAGDAIFAGFADRFIPHENWDDVKSMLARTGDITALPVFTAPPAPLADQQAAIDAAFGADNLSDILSGPLDADMQKTLGRNSPLAMACGVILINRARENGTVNGALAQEYRFTYRAVAQSDFIEGIRAAIIDKDRKPRWQALTDAAVTNMIAPLGPDTFEVTGETP